MGKGQNSAAFQDPDRAEKYSWEEIRKRSSTGEAWIVIEGKVYDVGRWKTKHPGGARLLEHFVGQDATDVWTAMHNDRKLVSKYMKSMLVGEVGDHTEAVPEKRRKMDEDFRDLRQVAETTRLFEVQPLFFIFQLAQILVLEVLAYWVFSSYGTGWLSWTVAVALMVIAQAQAGWLQHDFGHLSVFNSSRLNHIMHHFVVGQLMGLTHSHWNFRHFQHHAKPNVHDKDPDLGNEMLVLGLKRSVQWGQLKKRAMPYQYQHQYYWPGGAIVVFNLFVEGLTIVSSNGLWMELVVAASHFLRVYLLYSPLVGPFGVLFLMLVVRLVYSYWFTLVTQMSHIPMEIDEDQDHDWLTSQTITTCNVEQSAFNDWFSGHLNFQIEHHLFPTMPRHNYHKVAPLVKSLCQKHDVSYTIKPLGEAVMDVPRSLFKYGQLWYKAYNEA